MADVKITDLVPQETIDKIKELDTELKTLLDTYTGTAKDLAKGLDINVKVIGDVDKLEQLLVVKAKEATATNEKLTGVLDQQRQVIANTSNTMSRQLMEQERVNKAQREAYTEGDKVKDMLQQLNDTYEQNLESLIQMKAQMAKNKEEQKQNEKAYKEGKLSLEQFIGAQKKLEAQYRGLAVEKSKVESLMKAEEKMNASAETSYSNMSQQLELLKKAYKELTEEQRNAGQGRELEAAIQNLDAHLKDTAANMGEFQRNVGNYAIAGQNGVVSTESLVAVLGQEAKTIQDLADQTKILDEAKTMLNRNDVNYEQILQRVNDKLDENKRKLTDVSDILHKGATSVAEAEAQNKRLKEALKHVDLTSADAQKRIEELNDKISFNTKLIKENTPALQDQEKANEGLVDNMLRLVGLNSRFGSSLKSLESNVTGNLFDGLNAKVKAFSKTLIGLLSNPWVLSFLGIAGVVAGFKWWYDYNKGLEEASKLTKNFTDFTGDAADKVTSDMQTLADHMGKGYDETISAANDLVQQFGISWKEAIDIMEDGLVAGADMSGNMLNNIKQYSGSFKDAGVSASEFMAILSETRNGIFNEKALKSISDAGVRLRAMSKSTEAALDSVGISAKQMQKDLADGNITMLEAVQQVSSKLEELPPNCQQVGDVMKNVFGKKSMMAGEEVAKSIKDINDNLDSQKAKMGELGRINEEHMDAQKKLNETIASVFKMSGTGFQEMTTQIKTYIITGLTSIINGCVSIANWFIRLYNSAMVFRGVVQSLKNVFMIMWDVCKFIFSHIVDSFKAAGKVIEGVFTLDWDLVKQGWQDGMNALKGNVKALANDLAGDFSSAFNKTVHDNIKEIEVGYDENAIPGIEAPSKKTPKSIGAKPDKEAEKEAAKQAKEAAKRAKEAEKEAKEELKRINELEEAKIGIMEEGHEKELALIRLKFKKKIDEIKGEGATQLELRLQLAEQCEYEVAECERKYQTELSKINLENRLASVKKGSKEELDLKLAQLEASRTAELEAAKKTGADITLIEAKYEKQRREMQEEYAKNRTDKIQSDFAIEEEIRETAHIKEVADLNKKYTKILSEAKGNQRKREKAEEDFQKEMRDIAQKYTKETAESTIKMYEKMLEDEELSIEERIAVERKLAKAKAELERLIAEFNKDTQDNATPKTPKWVEDFQKWAEVAAEALNGINDLAQTIFDNQIDRIEQMQEALQESSDAEIERVDELVEKKVISEEEGEARKRAAEAKTAAENEKLERKKQQLKIKQAKWDKANSLAQAAISTALAITKALPNVVMAAIAGAMGALQIATILATPIPAYAKGTDRHKGGPAIVGDGGRKEVVLFNGEAWLTPDRPTLVDIPAGATVLPSVNEMDLLPNPVNAPSIPVVQVIGNDYDDAGIRKGVSELAYLLRAQLKQQRAENYLAKYELFKSKI